MAHEELFRGRGWTLGLSLALSLAVAACSDDDGTDEPEDAGQQDTAPPMDAGCVPFEGDDPIIEALLLCGTVNDALCEAGGRCVPNQYLDGAGGTDFLAACDGNSTCVPEEFIAAGGEAVPFPCDSVAGAEGRCLSKCLPMVASQANVLPEDTCGSDHLCVPCYEPLSGTATGACTLSCDMPQEPPLTFDPCCSDLGSCVPSSLVPSAFHGALEDIPGCESEALCVPNKFIEDTGYQPPSCDAEADGTSLGDGACLPLCLALAGDDDAGDLEQDVCDEGEVCVPCVDPVSGEPTGACDIGGGGDDPPDDAGVGDAGVGDAGVDDAGVDAGV
jgi:hypothetical protein